jgi:uncharacterized membrane protein (TIGR02234 family)
VVPDVAVRAAHLADVPVVDLVDTQRHYTGAVITLAAAVVTLAAAVLLMRSAVKERGGAVRYRRRTAPAPEEPASERTLWDALDEGRDPTDPDNKGR